VVLPNSPGLFEFLFLDQLPCSLGTDPAKSFVNELPVHYLLEEHTMKFSTASTFSIDKRARVFGIALIGFAFVLIHATVSVGEQPNEKKAYAKWVTSYDEAVEQSQETGRPIMLVFTGSDWCTWCHRLSDEVFMTHEFARWSSDNVIKVEVDFPQSHELPAELQTQNLDLKAQFGKYVSSYPTVLFATADGQFIGKTGYVAGGPQAWIQSAPTMVSSPAAKTKLLARSK
jgi:protein disulfide-isomerase